MGFLKNVAAAFKPSHIKQGLDAARNPMDQAAIEASLAALTPEQRAAYDANMARIAEAQAEANVSYQAAREIEDQHRVLRGPAGKHVYGAGMADLPTPDDLQRTAMEQGSWAMVQQVRESHKGELRNAVRQSFNRAAGRLRRLRRHRRAARRHLRHHLGRPGPPSPLVTLPPARRRRWVRCRP